MVDHLPRNTIFIAEGEELVSVLERIHASPYNELFVVIPGGAALGRSALNLKILKKEAEQHDKVLRVVAEDPGLQRLAAGLAIAWEGNVERFWERMEGHMDTVRTRHASEHIRMSDIKEPSEDEHEHEDTISAPSEESTSEESHQAAFMPESDSDPVPDSSPQPEPMDHGRVVEKEDSVSDTIVRLYHRLDKAESAQTKRAKKKLFAGKSLKPEHRSWLVLGGFIVVAVGLFAVVASVVLPRADVALTPRSERASAELAIISDASRSVVSAEQAAIPGQILEVSDTTTRTFPATGQRNVQDPARGIITVYNEFSSDPQTLVRTTRFLSEGGRVFRTAETVVVPGAKIENGQIIASSLDVEVIADEPGPEFNIGPSRFTIPGFQGTPKYDGFYGESSAPMEGGAVGTVAVVTENDIAGARQLVEQELQSRVEQQLSSTIPENFVLLDGVQEVQTTAVEISHEADQIADEFTVSLSVRARVFVFRNEDVAQVIQDRLTASVTEQNRMLREESLEMNFALNQVDFDNETLRFVVDAEEMVAWVIDEEQLRQELRGKSEEGVRDVLDNHPEISAVEVTFWPFWVNTVPDNSDRIDIIVQ